jgi:integrase
MAEVRRVSLFGPDKVGGGEYEVRWRVFLTDGTQRDRRKRHARKGLADATVDNLRKAEVAAVERNGHRWGWDDRLHPVLMNSAPVADAQDTVWKLITDWRTATWRTNSGNGRKNHSYSLRMMARYLVRDNAPPPPSSVDAYLRLVAFRNIVEPTRDELLALGEIESTGPGTPRGPVPAYELWEGREWLEEHSLPLAQLSRVHLRRMLTAIGEGRAANTERRYWISVKSVLNWGAREVDPGAAPRVAPGLTIGVAVRGSTSTTVGEVGAVPTDKEMWRMAWACGLRRGPRWCALPVVMGGAGLRIGECAALLRRHIREDTTTGGMWIVVRNNRATPGKAWTDSGERAEHRGTKGKGTEGNRKGRTTFLPPEEAKIMRLHLELFVGAGLDSPVFTGAQGARLDTPHLQRDVWKPARELAFPAPHRLHELNRHAFRHLAVTRWLRSGVPLTTAARWGGWAKVSTMVDFYDSVLPNDDHSGAAVMSGRAEPALRAAA